MVPMVLVSNWPLGLQLMGTLIVLVSAYLLPGNPAFYLKQAKLFSFCHSFLLQHGSSYCHFLPGKLIFGQCSKTKINLKKTILKV